MKALIVLIVSLTAFSSWAEKIYVKNARGTGVTEADVESTTELIRIAVGDQGHEVVETRDQAELILSPRLIRLGSAYVVSLKKFKGKKAIYSAKLKAASMEDMDSVTSRLVKAVLKQKSAKKNTRLNEVTRQESENSNRRIKATQQYYFGFGPSSFHNMNETGSGLSGFLGRTWGVNDYVDLKLNGFLSVGKTHAEASMTGFLLELDYFFSPTDYSFFVTGGVGYAVANAYEGGSANGFTGSVGAGLKLFRTSTVNLAFLAKHIQIFEKLKNYGNPATTMFSIAIYY